MAPFHSRRRFLHTLLASTGSLFAPRVSAAFVAPGSTSLPPFSRFTDVAAQAGLTQPIFYGTPGEVSYIVESMGGGCAFFDFDNDGWMDIFVVGGRQLGSILA